MIEGDWMGRTPVELLQASRRALVPKLQLGNALVCDALLRVLASGEFSSGRRVWQRGSIKGREAAPRVPKVRAKAAGGGMTGFQLRTHLPPAPLPQIREPAARLPYLFAW